MKKIISKSFLTTSIILGLTLLSFTGIKEQTIKGWLLAGSKPDSYEIGVVKNKERGTNVAFMKSIDSEINGFGTIMQNFEPGKFLDKKVKLTCYIKSKNIKKWAGMWLRIDGVGKKSLGFDNMQNRPIKGTTDWTKYEIILKVPKEATNIAYGVLTSGTGEVLIDDFKFEIVSDDHKNTGHQGSIRLTKPTNVDFEESF
ncbi:hypothetical protein [Flavivirga jejuensis]|uniref:NADH:ubiquinone oxidoreductase intermediate-associated protein 30 domain-containing protein n=1 Tax=Flavivirga jejuensis TaxID=870487 RepID=A0ABT8WRZ6_9FLAO|nr:hypothetical protein [Flavivirga jejuensis]MDO5975656.1 hypothetical protein [Flavivirga jejuensis]